VVILSVLAVSILSRATRSTELRAERIELDRAAERFLIEAGPRPIRFVAHHPGPDDPVGSPSAATPNERGDAYRLKTREARAMVHLPPGEIPLFVEVHVPDASEFGDRDRGSRRRDRRQPRTARRGVERLERHRGPADLRA
jgi:hypothetical protein